MPPPSENLFAKSLEQTLPSSVTTELSSIRPCGNVIIQLYLWTLVSFLCTHWVLMFISSLFLFSAV